MVNHAPGLCDLYPYDLGLCDLAHGQNRGHDRLAESLCRDLLFPDRLCLALLGLDRDLCPCDLDLCGLVLCRRPCRDRGPFHGLAHEGGRNRHLCCLVAYDLFRHGLHRIVHLSSLSARCFSSVSGVYCIRTPKYLCPLCILLDFLFGQDSQNNDGVDPLFETLLRLYQCSRVHQLAANLRPSCICW
jgi:hypothetical protein